MLSSHLFFCLYLILAPFTVPCLRAVYAVNRIFRKQNNPHRPSIVMDAKTGISHNFTQTTFMRWNIPCDRKMSKSTLPHHIYLSAKCCQRLEFLELNHMSVVTKSVVKELTDVGLKSIRDLKLIGTPIESDAVNLLYSKCNTSLYANILNTKRNAHKGKVLFFERKGLCFYFIN